MKPSQYLCKWPHKDVEGEIHLSGSKSISNRVLIINALMQNEAKISNLSDSDDTTIMRQLLSQQMNIFDAHHAGTTYRFLTAYLALKGKECILTGSDRMQKRPIGPLVDALNQIGARISYVNNLGYPPLKIEGPIVQVNNILKLDTGVSSQYISALLLIAPYLPEGLTIYLEGDTVSKPYLDMTVSIMKTFGADIVMTQDYIQVKNGFYKPIDYFVESDWSAASYYYTIAALSRSCTIDIGGLQSESLQGDAQMAYIAKSFGIVTEHFEHSIRISKPPISHTLTHFEYNFIKQPDLAQSLATLCAGLGTTMVYTGLQTLKIKETDRIQALKNELKKLSVSFNKLPAFFAKKSKMEYYIQEGKVTTMDDTPIISTYEDHRMAMSFAPLSLLTPIIIEDPMVVTKSYPNFWDDVQSLGLEIS